MAALGISLIVGGAFIAWGVDAFANGFDLQPIGYLMMCGGAIASTFAALTGVGSMPVTTASTLREHHASPAARRYVEHTQTR